MSQAGRVTYFEARRHLRSFRYLLATAMVVLLSALVTWLGYPEHGERRESHRQSLAEQAEELRSVTVYSFWRPLLVRSPEPLAIFERGVVDHAGREVVVSPFTVPEQAAATARRNPYLARWLDLDLTTVVVVGQGLLALLLTFDLFVGEWARRRFDILRAHGGSRPALIAGKICGALLALFLSLLASLGPPLAVLLSEGILGSHPGSLLRLAGLLATYGAYGVAMALVGCWISLRTESEARSLVYAVLAWLVLIFLLPAAATSLRDAVVGLSEDSEALERELSRLDAELEGRLEALWREDPLRVDPSGHSAPVVMERWDRGILRRLGSARFYDSVARFHAEEVRLGRRHAEERHELIRRHRQRRESAGGPMAALRLVLPGAAVEDLTAILAGTSEIDQELFLDAARRHRQRLLDELEERGVIGSWRWFTDDPPETVPWVSFLGLEPEDVGPENLSEMAERFRDPAVQARVEAELARRGGEDFRLELSGLPTFEVDPAAASSAAVSAALRLLGLLAFLAWLLGRALRRFVADLESVPAPSSADSSATIPSTEAPWAASSESQGPRSDAVDSGPSPGSSAAPSRAARTRRLVASELGEILAEPRWRLIGALGVLFMLLFSLIQGLHQRHAASVQESRLESYRAALTGATLADAVQLEHLALRPPAPEGFLATGGETAMPAVYELPITTWRLPTLRHFDIAGRPLSIEAPDWSTAVWVLLSLSVFLLGHDALSGRRLERFETMIALGERRTVLLFSKAAALWLATAIPWLAGAGGGLGVLWLVRPPSVPAPDPAKVAAFLLLGLVGLAFFVILALGASALVGRSDHALVTLLLFWVAAETVIPSTAAITVSSLQSVASPRQVASAIDEIGREIEAIEGSSDWRPGRWARLDDFAVERRSAELQRIRRRRQAELLREAARAELAQAELARHLSYLSPLALLQDAGERLIGVGQYRQRDFLRQARGFDRRLRDWARAVDARDESSAHLCFFPRYLSRQPIDAAGVPRFVFEEPSLAAGLRRARSALLLFVAAFALAVALLSWTVRQRVVRGRTVREWSR